MSRLQSHGGKGLPSICKDTIDATDKLFEEYYASKSASVE